jgi:hypothetical protein
MGQKWRTCSAFRCGRWKVCGCAAADRPTSNWVDASVLAAVVSDMPVARVEAINSEGLQAQVAYLLEAYGPGEN